MKSILVQIDPPKPDLKVWASKNSLVQVFVNLFMNARDAMGERGALYIQIRPQGSEWVEVRVRDEGPGIAEQILDHVTEPFFTTKAEGKGTGLGLAICREILEIEHQGEFIVTNHQEQGAEFILRLPVPRARDGHGQG